MYSGWSSATEAFVCNPHLLGRLGEQTVNYALLHSLCLVNWTFNDAITPALYRVLRMNEKFARQLWITWDDYKIFDKNVRYTREFYIDQSAVSIIAASSYMELFKEHTICVLLQHMPSLLLFEAPHNMVIEAEVLNMIHTWCPRLKSISICNPVFLEPRESVEADRRPTIYGTSVEQSRPAWMPSPHHLSNLTNLSLRNLRFDISWPKRIAKTISFCPNLIHLTLSLGYAHHASGMPIIGSTTLAAIINTDFLPLICSHFEEFGASRLRLKSLNLGSGVRMCGGLNSVAPMGTVTDGEVPPALYLDKLTDLSFLQDVHVHITEDVGDTTAWNTFSQQQTPNLRRISVMGCSKNLHSWLAGLDGAFTSRLAIKCADRYSRNMSVAELIAQGSIPLRMAHVGMSLDDPTRCWPYDRTDVQESPWRYCDGLEGLSLVLWDCGIEVTPERQLFGIISQLHKLQQLRMVHRGSIRYGTNLTKTHYPHSVAKRICQELAEICPRLQFVQIDGRVGFQIDRGDDGVTLTALDEQEQDEVELFQSTPI